MAQAGCAANRLIFQTLKAVLDSDNAITAAEISIATGFNKRMTQRHTEVLTNSGLIRRSNREEGRGFAYIRNIQFLNPNSIV